MTDRERQAWLRLLVVVAAAALGETIAVAVRLGDGAILLVVLLGGAAFYLTGPMDRPGGGGEARYWRGRRLD